LEFPTIKKVLDASPDAAQLNGQQARSDRLVGPLCTQLYVDAAVAVGPLRGQLYLDGEELVVPDPALSLLTCKCSRLVSVRPPGTSEDEPGWDEFVEVCIDCGAVQDKES